MKIVINSCYGGFDLTPDERILIASKAPELLVDGRLDIHLIPRHHPALVEAVERFAEEPHDPYAELEVIEVPDGIEYDILDNDGIETVYEIGHAWGCLV